VGPAHSESRGRCPASRRSERRPGTPHIHLHSIGHMAQARIFLGPFGTARTICNANSRAQSRRPRLVGWPIYIFSRFPFPFFFFVSLIFFLFLFSFILSLVLFNSFFSIFWYFKSYMKFYFGRSGYILYFVNNFLNGTISISSCIIIILNLEIWFWTFWTFFPSHMKFSLKDCVS
jgi:hypothetical protein